MRFSFDRLGLADLPLDKMLWAGGLFAVSAVISLVLVAVVVVLLPETYFLESWRPETFARRHPVVRFTLRVLKNVLGVTLVLVGIGLSLPGIPGQGLLTILVGLVLLDYPGKKRLEAWLVRPPRVRKALNRLRGRFGRPPLRMEAE